MKLTVLLMFFIFAPFTVYSLGDAEKMNNAQHPSVETATSGDQSDSGGGNTVTIVGKVQIYGNEPHTFVGIVDTHGKEYAVYPPAREKELEKLQGRLIEFTVVLLAEPQGYGGLFLKGGTVTPVDWKVIQ